MRLPLKQRPAQSQVVVAWWCVGEGVHSPADDLAHIFGHHYGPFGLRHRRNLGYDNRNRLALYQLVDRKIANGRE
ncbi:unnamed protein product [Sphagnum balticum]